MKLTVEFTSTSENYSLLFTIYNNNACILRTNYKHIFEEQDKDITLEELHLKISNMCIFNKPFELFSDNLIHCGSSISFTFASRAFLIAHTLMPSYQQELTTNNIFPLTIEQELQFYCEFNKLLQDIKNNKNNQIDIYGIECKKFKTD